MPLAKASLFMDEYSVRLHLSPPAHLTSAQIAFDLATAGRPAVTKHSAETWWFFANRSYQDRWSSRRPPTTPTPTEEDHTATASPPPLC